MEEIHADAEVGQFNTILGVNLRNLQLEFNATTFVYEPNVATNTVFWCYLTRIDDFKVTRGQEWYSRTNGIFSQSGQSAFTNLVTTINNDLTA